MPHVDIYRSGKKLVSATELTSIISKPFLETWKEGLCEPTQQLCGFVRAKQIAEEAADLGNNVHEIIEQWIKNPSIEWVKQEEGEALVWANQIVNVYKRHKVKSWLHEAEATLIDTPSGLAGSPDHVIEIEKDGEMVKAVGDLKIKNQLDKLTSMQGCAYKYLLKRKYGEDIKWMVVAWCQKKSKNKTVKLVWYDLDEAMPTWYSLVKLWNFCNPSRKVIVND